MEQNLRNARGRLRPLRFLLLAVAVAASLDQALLGFLVVVTLAAGGWQAWQERKAGTGLPGEAAGLGQPGRNRPRLWPRPLQALVLLLLADAYLSLHSPANVHPFETTFNFFYVVGQYAAVVWLLGRFGSYFAGRPLFGRDDGDDGKGGAGSIFSAAPRTPSGSTRRPIPCCGTASIPPGATRTSSAAISAPWRLMGWRFSVWRRTGAGAGDFSRSFWRRSFAWSTRFPAGSGRPWRRN